MCNIFSLLKCIGIGALQIFLSVNTFHNVFIFVKNDLIIRSQSINTTNEAQGDSIPIHHVIQVVNWNTPFSKVVDKYVH